MNMLEHKLEMLAIGRAQPFQYDHTSGTFQFGDEEVAVKDVGLFGSAHASGEDLNVDDIREYMTTVPFVHTFIHPIQLPAANAFFQHGWNADIASETREIMADVLIANTERFKRSDRAKLLARGSFGVLRREEPEDVIVSTVGACACLGPDYTTHFSDPELQIMEYTYHNVDGLPQKLSLMSGLGHIARRAQEWLDINKPDLSGVEKLS